MVECVYEAIIHCIIPDSLPYYSLCFLFSLFFSLSAQSVSENVLCGVFMVVVIVMRKNN